MFSRIGVGILVVTFLLLAIVSVAALVGFGLDKMGLLGLVAVIVGIPAAAAVCYWIGDFVIKHTP